MAHVFSRYKVNAKSADTMHVRATFYGHFFNIRGQLVVYKRKGTSQPRLSHIRGLEHFASVSHYIYVYGDNVVCIGASTSVRVFVSA